MSRPRAATDRPVTIGDIEEAGGRIREAVVRTPCTRSRAFEDLVSADLFLKRENEQRTGSFKDRGALNRLLFLTEDERKRGVVTASAGNHAQAMAHHARRLEIPATVVMPETAPFTKVSSTLAHGARVVQSGTVLDESAVEARRLVDAQGLTMIHPFDDPYVIAGQGTVGLEVAEQVPDVDTIVVPVGGGGLISGTALALRDRLDSVRVIGVEAEAAPSAHASREAGRIVKIQSHETLADGIATKRAGDLTFPMIEELVDELVVVSEEDIASSILLLLEREKTVVEGAGAVPLAALVAGAARVRPEEKVVLVLSGGNIDLNRVSRIIDRGLVADGRLARLMVTVPDRPGSLARLTRVVADHGANVLDIRHRRAFADISVGEVGIVMHIETRGREHVDEIIAVLEAEGHAVHEER